MILKLFFKISDPNDNYKPFRINNLEKEESKKTHKIHD